MNTRTLGGASLAILASAALAAQPNHAHAQALFQGSHTDGHGFHAQTFIQNYASQSTLTTYNQFRASLENELRNYKDIYSGHIAVQQLQQLQADLNTYSARRDVKKTAKFPPKLDKLDRRLANVSARITKQQNRIDKRIRKGLFWCPFQEKIDHELKPKLAKLQRRHAELTERIRHAQIAQWGTQWIGADALPLVTPFEEGVARGGASGGASGALGAVGAAAEHNSANSLDAELETLLAEAEALLAESEFNDLHSNAIELAATQLGGADSAFGSLADALAADPHNSAHTPSARIAAWMENDSVAYGVKIALGHCALGVALGANVFNSSTGDAAITLGDTYTPYAVGSCAVQAAPNLALTAWASARAPTQRSQAYGSLVDSASAQETILGARAAWNFMPGANATLEARHGSGAKGKVVLDGDALALDAPPWTQARVGLSFAF